MSDAHPQDWLGRAPTRQIYAKASPAGGGSPNISDDVIAVSAPQGLSDYVVVSARPFQPGNQIVIRACWIPGSPDAPPDPPPLVFHYVTFDSP